LATVGLAHLPQNVVFGSMRREVLLNVEAEQELAELHTADPALAGLIESMLDGLEAEAETLEHEPWPHERGSAFLTHVFGTSWHLAWVYSRDRNQVLIGKLFEFPKST
jgi:hypothetical protein